MSGVSSPTWPPPEAPVPRTAGWYLASDGRWYPSAQPPGAGYWLASDGLWYPPMAVTWPAQPAITEQAWRQSRWGLGDVWWGVLAYVVANMATLAAIFAVLAVSDPDRLEDTSLGPYAISISIIGNVVAFAGVPWLASRRKGLRSLAADFGLRFRPVDLAIGLGVGVAALMSAGAVSLALDALLGAEEATSNMPVDDLPTTGEFLAFLVAVGIVTPVIEELFFRGLVLRSFLKRGRGAVVSITATTLVFVVPHLMAAESWQGLVTLSASITVLGLSFALACNWTDGRLGAPIVAHALVNTLAVVATFLG